MQTKLLYHKMSQNSTVCSVSISSDCSLACSIRKKGKMHLKGVVCWKILNKQMKNVNKFLKMDENYSLSNAFVLYQHGIKCAPFQYVLHLLQPFLSVLFQTEHSNILCRASKTLNEILVLFSTDDIEFSNKIRSTVIFLVWIQQSENHQSNFV